MNQSPVTVLARAVTCSTYNTRSCLRAASACRPAAQQRQFEGGADVFLLPLGPIWGGRPPPFVGAPHLLYEYGRAPRGPSGRSPR
eukprot:scaffold8631_cov108-Isochrysis_galbana.AAC.23